MEKQAVKRIKRLCVSNRGTAIVEAAVGVTIFLFVSLVLFHFLHVAAVRTVVYEAAVEAAEYTAELAYLESTLTGNDEEKKAGAAESFLGSASLMGAAEIKLMSSLDEPELVSRYILGGKAGIILLGSEFPDENGDIVLHVTYTVRIDTPLLPTLTWVFEDEICQKPYLGHNVSDGEEQEDGDDEDPYVYVAENGTVYHTRRTCTHLLLKITPGTKKSAVSSGYHACEFCGAGAGDYVLICPEGESYHTSANCRGLKRTVHRVRLSEVKGMPACSRCGK